MDGHLDIMLSAHRGQKNGLEAANGMESTIGVPVKCGGEHKYNEMKEDRKDRGGNDTKYGGNKSGAN